MSVHPRNTGIALVAGIIAICALVAGIAFLVDINRSAVRKFREDIEVTIDFRDESVTDIEDTTSVAVLQQMKAYLEHQPFTRAVRIITKDEALKIESLEEGTDIREYLGYNPLFSSITLRLKEEYVHADSLEKIAALVSQNKYVSTVTWPTEMVKKMPGFVRSAHTITGAIALILITVAAYIVRRLFFRKET